VLEKSGYEAHPATIPEGLKQVSDKSYDLIVVSKRMAERHPELFSDLQNLVVLEGLTFPDALLAAVAKKLESPPGPLNSGAQV
jgi:hypothetical protein